MRQFVTIYLITLKFDGHSTKHWAIIEANKGQNVFTTGWVKSGKSSKGRKSKSKAIIDGGYNSVIVLSDNRGVWQDQHGIHNHTLRMY